LTNIPLMGAMGLIAWRLQLVKFLSPTTMYGIWAFLVGLFVLQTYQAFKVNREVVLGQKNYPAGDRYQISQVFILELAYAVSFGSELAVVSMLPEYFEHTFNLSHQIAGPVAATYPLMNLVSRPAGGLIMSQINPGMGLPFSVFLTMFCAFFVFAGAGATFGIAPLIKRRVTGQIAGNVGAYGSVGSVLYATAYSLLPQTVAGNHTFFQVLGFAGIVVAFLCAFLLKEPKVSQADLEAAAMVAH
jgi:MFS transporter, NNP family, nitrate/nitrite transporter